MPAAFEAMHCTQGLQSHTGPRRPAAATEMLVCSFNQILSCGSSSSVWSSIEQLSPLCIGSSAFATEAHSTGVTQECSQTRDHACRCRFPVKLAMELMQADLRTCWWGIVVSDEHHTFRVALTTDQPVYLPLLRAIAPDPDDPSEGKAFLWCKRASDSSLHISCQEDRPKQSLTW